VCIPGIHWIVYGDIDPFAHWPRLLEFSAFVLTMIVTWQVRSPLASVLGLYAGLIVLMLASGGSEYPVASMIALAAHQFIPAALAFGLALWIRYLLRHPTNRENRAGVSRLACER
jgi:hypothetical protein